MSIYCLSVQKKYQSKILGFGEIYEQVSVEKKRKALKKKFKSATLLLASNKDHSGRGLTLEELKIRAQNQGYKVLTKGYVDSPPWKSKKRIGVRALSKNILIATLAKIIFSVLVYFEPFMEGKRRSHMAWVVVAKFKI